MKNNKLLLPVSTIILYSLMIFYTGSFFKFYDYIPKDVLSSYLALAIPLALFGGVISYLLQKFLLKNQNQ